MKKTLCMLFCVLPLFSVSAATYGQKVVAAVLMAEAWGEGEIGMTAVAEVIARRSELEQRSPLAIVTIPRHFSCLNKTTPEALYSKFAGKPDFQVALRIARTLYNEPEKLPGYVKNADHFTRLDEKPFWVRGRPPVVVIGNHAFYRLNNG